MGDIVTGSEGLTRFMSLKQGGAAAEDSSWAITWLMIAHGGSRGERAMNLTSIAPLPPLCTWLILFTQPTPVR